MVMHRWKYLGYLDCVATTVVNGKLSDRLAQPTDTPEPQFFKTSMLEFYYYFFFAFAVWHPDQHLRRVPWLWPIGGRNTPDTAPNFITCFPLVLCEGQTAHIFSLVAHRDGSTILFLSSSITRSTSAPTNLSTVVDDVMMTAYDH